MSPQTTQTVSCIKQAVAEVLPFWLMAGIKTILIQSAEKKLLKAWTAWTKLNKNKSRLSDPKGKRTVFVDQLDRLWDIGAEDAVEVIQQNKFLTPEKKEEHISFYRDQQNERLGRMSGRDKIYAARIKEKSIRLQRMDAS